MKTKAILTLVLSFLTIGLSANDAKYRETMLKAIEQVYKARELGQFQEIVNTFERIAGAEKDRWEPLYYLAYGNLMMANLEKEQASKDTYLDKALKAVEAAKLIAPAESEIFALEGFSHMLRITVDPQQRGMVYTPKAMQAYQKALALNADNPRALALLAQMQYGTARFFGDSTAGACEMNIRAVEKFGSYKSANELAPQWGRSMAEQMAERCK